MYPLSGHAQSRRPGATKSAPQGRYPRGWWWWWWWWCALPVELAERGLCLGARPKNERLSRCPGDTAAAAETSAAIGER